MPSPQYVSIANGQSVSSMFVVDRADRALGIAIASHAALQWFTAWATTSGGPFLRLSSPEGNGAPWCVMSYAAGGIGIVTPPTPYGRLETSAGVSATTSIALLTVQR